MTKKQAKLILAGVTGGSELEAAKVAGDKFRATVLQEIQETHWKMGELTKCLMRARQEWAAGVRSGGDGNGESKSGACSPTSGLTGQRRVIE